MLHVLINPLIFTPLCRFFPVHAGEEIHGTISCAPNDKNVRDLDITIAHKYVTITPIVINLPFLYSTLSSSYFFYLLCDNSTN